MTNNNNYNNNIILPTETDIIFSHLVTNRILLRRLFEELRDRPKSKYFKNVIITDIPWDPNVFPKNFPIEFLKKYPSNFKISFTHLGCNMLKCYQPKDNNNNNNNNNNSINDNNNNPILINNLYYANSEACIEIYKEFNSYLKEKFNLKLNDDDDDDDDNFQSFPLETFSIKDGKTDTNYCGVQLTPLKTFSLVPSSRWRGNEEENLSLRDYIAKYKKTNPIQLGELAGLVDAPPLTWNTEKQNASFNAKYCTRFNKAYDEENDECYFLHHRKALNFFFGESLVNQFPDFEDALKNWTLPMQHVYDYVLPNGSLSINKGYIEREINQQQLEDALYVDIPDMITNNVYIVNNNNNDNNNDNDSTTISSQFNKIKRKMGSIIIDFLYSVGQDTAIDASLTTLPNVGAHLIKHYSATFLKNILQTTTTGAGGNLPIAVKMASLMTRMAMNKLTINLAIRILTTFAKGVNAFFTVTLITVIPDILLLQYNIGGFNNEITREYIEEYRQSFINACLKTYVKQFDGIVKFLLVDDGSYVTPHITPEFVYHLCLINFLQKYYKQKVNICHDGLGPEEEREKIASEYIRCLKVNSIGQTIQYDDAVADNDNDIVDDDDDEYKKHNEFDKQITLNIIQNNIDVYFLIVAIILLMISLLLFSFHPKISIFLACPSLLLFTIWFTVFQPYVVNTVLKNDK